MRSPYGSKKGVVLLVVLGIILVTIILANVILNITFSQTRLTHHQVSRIQAYYAAMAGMNAALYNLSNGDWNSSSCSASPCVINDDKFPGSIRSQSVQVILCPSGGDCQGRQCRPPAGTTLCIYSIANYTYPGS